MRLRPALLAGLNFSFYPSPWGISMRVSGYTDKQGVLLNELLGPLRHPALDEQRFEDLRDRSVRALKNRVATRPSGQAMAKLNEALLHSQWSDDAMIAAFEAMTVGDVRDFVERFWPTVRAEMLAPPLGHDPSTYYSDFQAPNSLGHVGVRVDVPRAAAVGSLPGSYAALRVRVPEPRVDRRRPRHP